MTTLRVPAGRLDEMLARARLYRLARESQAFHPAPDFVHAAAEVTHEAWAGQLTTSTAGFTAISATKHVDEGVRTMLLLAPGLFRLDARVHEDTLRFVVRNLSDGELHMGGDRRGYGRPLDATAVAGPLPTRFDLEFELGTYPQRIRVEAIVTTIKHQEVGTVTLVAQAAIAPAR